MTPKVFSTDLRISLELARDRVHGEILEPLLARILDLCLEWLKIEI